MASTRRHPPRPRDLDRLRAAAAAALAVVACTAACTAAHPAGRSPAGAGPGAREAAISAAEAKGVVEWLADPARTGRGVGTPGNAAAAAYLADHMKALGLEPGGDGGFLQPF